MQPTPDKNPIVATPQQALEMAMAHHQQGRLAQAAPIYREILRVVPRHPDALHLLGVLHHQRGQQAEAIDLIRQAIAITPSVADFHTNLGVALWANDQREEAVTSYRHAIELNAQTVDAHSNLGDALRQLGDVEEAEQHLHTALSLNPRHPAAHNNLGAILIERRSFNEAIKHLQAALDVQPRYVEALRNLGFAKAAKEEYEAAITLYRQALKIAADDAVTHYRYGSALKLDGQPIAALEQMQEAVRLNPEYAEALNGLAEVLFDLGRAEEAVPLLHESRRVKPDQAMVYVNFGQLAEQGLYEFTPEETADLEERLSREGLPLSEASAIAFTLGGHFDRNGNTDRTFEFLRQGNELKKQDFAERDFAFDRDAHQRFVDVTIETFDRSFFERRSTHGNDSERPVFVIGMPRSGTSLVEQILASHPKVYGAGELRLIERIARSLRGRRSSNTGYPRCLTSLDGSVLHELASSHVDALSALSDGASRVIDKLPANFLHLGLIATLFPQAKIIHCLRDPRDVGFSCYSRNFHAVNWAADLDDIAFFYRQYVRLMTHWRDTLPLKIHEIVYEELVVDQESHSRALIAHCGLDWDDACLDFHKSKRAVQTASRFQVRKPIYQSSAGRWQRFAEHLGPLLDLKLPVD